MKNSLTLLLLSLFITPAIASQDLIEEINNSYTKVSKKLEGEKSGSIIRQVYLSPDLNKLSMEDWIIYAKESTRKRKNGEDTKQIETIKFNIIDTFAQAFSFYQNESMENLDEDFKKLVIRSWWLAAMLDEEEREGLKDAYKVGKGSLIEKNDFAKTLLDNIEQYISA